MINWINQNRYVPDRVLLERVLLCSGVLTVGVGEVMSVFSVLLIVCV